MGLADEKTSLLCSKMLFLACSNDAGVRWFESGPSKHRSLADGLYYYWQELEGVRMMTHASVEAKRGVIESFGVDKKSFWSRVFLFRISTTWIEVVKYT